jgi:hypothetical protein
MAFFCIFSRWAFREPTKSQIDTVHGGSGHKADAFVDVDGWILNGGF